MKLSNTNTICGCIVIGLGFLSLIVTLVYIEINNGNVIKIFQDITITNQIYGKNNTLSNSTETTTYSAHRNYLVLWYSVLAMIEKRPEAMLKDFSPCEYSNCELTFNRSLIDISDAVLFDGRWVPFLKKDPLRRRKNGQVWIFAAHESPVVVHQSFRSFTSRFRGVFNWTMSYNKANDDIYLPYGEIRQRHNYTKREFLSIAKNKTKGGLIATSHCKTDSKRLEFLKELQKHTDVTILGSCGTKWNCGKATYHDNCFDILNANYAFYLAFENAICNEYYTEKLFENFNYDILIITRGGRKKEFAPGFPKGSVIRTDDFKTIKELGRYMTNLTASPEIYAKLLEEKNQYYSLNYADTYQNALCDLCYKMNHQDKFHKVIPDILATSVFNERKHCIKKSGRKMHLFRSIF